MWLFCTLVFVVGQVAFLQFFKRATRETADGFGPRLGALAVAVQLVSALAMVFFMPFFDWVWPSGWLVWVLLAIAFLLYAINDRMDATTRKNLDISADTLIQQVYRIFFFAFGIFFLGRAFTWAKLIGGVLIVFANMFLLFERGKFRFNRYVLLKVLSAVIFAAAFTIDTFNSPEFNLPFYVFLSFGAPALYLTACGLVARRAGATPIGIVNEFRRRGWWILAAGVSQGLASLGILRAYQFFDRFVEVAAISGVYVLLNAVFAFVFLRERAAKWQKAAAAAVIAGAIVLIAAG
jgi:drug/metabolite transporter (DMT)-like permease